MSEQHTALLKTARERLVEDRRAFAKIIAAPFEREKTRDAREKFIDIQAAIEAVDRAIEDEDRQVATHSYGVSSLKMSPIIVRARLCKLARCGRERLNLFSARGVPPSSVGSASAMLMNCCRIDSARA